MNKAGFITDVFDVLSGNTQYITQKGFIEKYGNLDIDLDLDNDIINISDEQGNGYILEVRQTFAPEPC